MKSLICKLVIVSIMVSLLGACASISRPLDTPDVTIDYVRLLPAQGFKQRFKIGLTVMNPNPVPITVIGMSYGLALEGEQLINGVSNNIPVLKPYTEVPVELEASTDLLSTLKFAESMLRRPRSEVSYELTAKNDIGQWLPAFHVTEQGVIPLTKE